MDRLGTLVRGAGRDPPTFPALTFFRSPRPGRSWLRAAEAALDAAALVNAACPTGPGGDRDIMIRVGFLALRDIADFFRIPHDPDPRPQDPLSIPRTSFAQVLGELEAAGVPLVDDRDQAWQDFAGWRVNYDAVLVGLARLTAAPPSHWDRPRGPGTQGSGTQGSER